MRRANGGRGPLWNRLEGAIPSLCNPIKKPQQGKTFSTPRQASQVNPAPKSLEATRAVYASTSWYFHCALSSGEKQIEGDDAISAMDKIGLSLEVWLELYFQIRTVTR